MPYVKHLYYEETGQGRPVIFVHCPALSHIYWRPVMERLKTFCRAIAIDIRGHGKSGRGETPWTFTDIGRDVALLTRELGLQRPVLVGYSAGSSISMQAALDEPGLFGGLVLVGAFSQCNSLLLLAKARVGLSLVRLGLVPFIGASVVGTNSVDKEHTRQMLPDARQCNPVALASFLQGVLRFDCTKRLPSLRLPVLLVYGTNDEPMHGYYHILQRGLPEARAVFVPDSDHRVPTRKPAEFADLVAEFLAGHPE
jgi:pimeloyl-ACP methyl ester carboxylesterase